jgi:hypothetical protein
MSMLSSALLFNMLEPKAAKAGRKEDHAEVAPLAESKPKEPKQIGALRDAGITCRLSRHPRALGISGPAGCHWTRSFRLPRRICFRFPLTMGTIGGIDRAIRIKIFQIFSCIYFLSEFFPL